VEKDGYRYAFVAVTTAHDGGIGGRVDQDLLDWTRGEFETRAPGAAHLFLFAHHNGPLIPDAGFLNPGGLVDEFDVTGYVAGHHHIDFEQTTAATRFAKTKNQWDGMPGSDDGWMRLFVLTGPTWATRTSYMVDRGPVVIVTSPQDQRLAVARSPEGVVSGLTEVTAMAFGDAEASLELTVDTFDPIAMTTEDGRTFTAEFDFIQAAPGEHILRVEDGNRVNDVNGIDEITVESAL
jgi:hypothetical protein